MLAHFHSAALLIIGTLAQTPAPETVVNSVGMRLVPIPVGEFVMGNRESQKILARCFPGYEAQRLADLTDDPPHHVCITKPFLMGAHRPCYRNINTPESRYPNLGFRIVLRTAPNAADAN